MIKNRNIIVFAEDWGRFPSTMQHIGLILSETNKILWVGSLGLRKPKFNSKDLRRIFEKGWQMVMRQRAQIHDQSLPVIPFHPFVIPFHDNWFIRKINNYFLLFQLKSKIRKLGLHNPILLTSSPIVDGFLGELDETSSHYFCQDDYSQFEGAFDSLIELENALLKKIDSVFAVSEILKNSRVPTNGNSYFLPQGVDIQHFQNKNTIPDEMKGIPGPIVGFFGLLASWIDLELIYQTAKKIPEASFVIIGKHVTDTTLLQDIPNIKLLGEIPYERLPEYAHCFNVGLIPFKINELTIAANPLKLLEYFAMGIPVVSTALPEVIKFNNDVYISYDTAGFVDGIRKALSNSHEYKNERLKEVAAIYSWRVLAEMISEKIENIERNKHINN